MKKTVKPTRKDFYMEIKKSPGRFLSILFIVALGVAFFSGIRASEPDMRLSGDSYFDGSRLMDIKALSTYGVTEKDVQAMGKADGVALAEGAYSADFLYNTADEQQVLHVMSIQEHMNQPALSKGRFPEKAGECLADDEAEFHIGDKIVLHSGTDDPVSDTLKTDTLEVVGLGNSPCYLSYGRGSSAVGDGSVSGFLLVPEETFTLEVYTEVYFKVEGAEELLAFTDEYDERIEEVLENVENITGERAEARRQEIIDEANEELDKARQELAQGKAEADQELADAAREIADAEEKLADAKVQIADGRTQIENAKAALVSKQAELDSAREQYASGLQQLADGRTQYENGKAQYENGKAQFEAEKPGAEAKIEEGRQGLLIFRGQLDEGWDGVSQMEQQIAGLEAAPLPPDDPGYDMWLGELEGLRAKLQEMKNELNGQESLYAENAAQLDTAENELNAAEAQLMQTKAGLDAAEAELNAAEAQLSGVPAELDSGQAQINSGWSQLYEKEAELNTGAAEVAENEGKLADAKKEYEDGKKEAEAEIADAEQEIKAAEEELLDIKLPKWYVYDRSTLIEYSGFGENAERLGAIGRVFPVLFFLVAALISLTSMTRMVEEQRTSIGTMKALGYSKAAIVSKYMGYALLATVGGSVIGVLIGEKILPYIIVYAYGILYRHLPAILVPYQWSYAVMASGAAVFCTMFATFMACYRELTAQPAVLMRPPAPKNGRRVFMERIGIIWRHLNFTWKSTIRNLMRYKKRFFMTIFGIGGCMALMLVGFGLKDSCYEIAELQYAEIQFYDGSVYLESDVTQEQRREIAETLEKEKNVTRFMNTNMQNITLLNGKKERAAYRCIFENAEDIPEYVDFHDRKSKEQYRLSDEGVIVSEKTAKLLGAKAGDTVEIKDEEKGNKKVRIEHICENYMGHYIYFTPAYYEKVYGEKPEYNSIFFSVKDDCTSRQMEETGKQVLKTDGALSVSYTHDIEKQLDDMLRSLNLVIVVLIISAGMLAFVVLYNLNTVNIAERKRELATLKVLGFYNGEVAQYVYRENILLTFLGAVVGVVLGKILHLFIIETVEVDSAMFGRNINPPSFIYSLALTVAFSMLINGVMYFKLKRIDMVESLKSIE